MVVLYNVFQSKTAHSQTRNKTIHFDHDKPDIDSNNSGQTLSSASTTQAQFLKVEMKIFHWVYMLCQTQKKISYMATVMIVDALIHNLPRVMKIWKSAFIWYIYIYISIATFLFNNIYLAWHIANNIRNVSQISFYLN